MNKKLLFTALFLTAPVVQATTISDICSSMTVSGNTATCVPTGGSVPTGCLAKANGGTALVSLPQTGGTVAFTVTGCSGTPTYHWTKNGVFGSTAASWSDVYSANGGANPVTNTYQVQACNGSACSNFPATPLNVTIAGTGGGGPPPGNCSGFTNVRNLTFNWASPVRLFTADVGGMGPNDVVVVAFTTGNSANPDNNLPRVVGAEFNGPPSTRIAVLSATACDFNAQAFPGASNNGTTVTIPFTVANQNNFGYYPILNKNTTYYFNVKNAAGSTCAALTECNMAFDLSKPGGMGLVSSAAVQKQYQADKSYAAKMLQEIKKRGLVPLITQ